MTTRITCLAALFATLALTSCSVDPNRVPVPGTGVENGYDLTIQFESALNLPDRAKVTMNGLRIGEVEQVQLAGDVVAVDARIDGDTRIPSDVVAIIRQNTLLGDTYVALDRDTSTLPTSFLSDGGVIDVAKTTSPPQLEDVMSLLANFVNGGNIQKVQDAVIQVNNVMPRREDLHRLADTVAIDLHDLAGNTAHIDQMLTQLDESAVAMTDNETQLQTLFSDDAAPYWYALHDSVLQYVGTLLPSIGSIFEGGIWLVPLFTSLADSATSIRDTAENVPADVDAVSRFLDGTLLPLLRDPSVNIESIQTRDGADITADVHNILRMLGAVQ